MEMPKFYAKDREIECPKCGAKQSLRKLIDEGEFDSMDFDENSNPQDFNPFDNSHPDWFTDRLSIPFNCHCSGCGEPLQVNVVTCVFGVDVFDDELSVIASLETERVE